MQPQWSLHCLTIGKRLSFVRSGVFQCSTEATPEITLKTKSTLWLKSSFIPHTQKDYEVMGISVVRRSVNRPCRS